MVKVKEIYHHIRQLAPEELAEDWDNIGLLLGDGNQNVTKILVCLDITTNVVREAIENKVNLIISHHPLIFKAIKKLDYGSFKNNIIRDLIKNNISVISAHTNLDSSRLGLNDYLASKLSLQETKPLISNMIDSEAGLGRIGILENEMPIEEFVECVKEKLELNFVKLIRSNDNSIKKIAVLGGSGASFLNDIPEDIDIYLTGDVGYHEAIDAIEMDKNILDIGHFAEKISKELLKEFLERLDISKYYTVISAKSERDPFEIF